MHTTPRLLHQRFLDLGILVQVPGGVSLTEKVTNFHVHSNLVHMPLSMELRVWLVIGGGCSQGGRDKGPPKLG